MILVVFLLPLSIYLFVIGSINRERRPVMVSGVIDFIGILFAGSGFLLLGGPAILGGLSERMRLAWLLGQPPGKPDLIDLLKTDWFWLTWIVLSCLYFLAILGFAVLALRAQRRLTSIYNAAHGLVEECLVGVCRQLGLDPMRVGNNFIFHAEPAGKKILAEGAESASALAAKVQVVMERQVVLTVETATAMRHVTLRWDPPSSAVRGVVETELEKVLAEIVVDPSPAGAWMIMGAVVLFGLSVIAGVALLAVRFAPHL